jgi:hypothetical protein
MTDSEREERAIWKLGQAGFTVKKEAGMWIVRDQLEEASVDNLAVLVDLAEAAYANHWTGRKVTPSA